MELIQTLTFSDFFWRRHKQCSLHFHLIPHSLLIEYENNAKMSVLQLRTMLDNAKCNQHCQFKQFLCLYLLQIYIAHNEALHYYIIDKNLICNMKSLVYIHIILKWFITHDNCWKCTSYYQEKLKEVHQRHIIEKTFNTKAIHS